MASAVKEMEEADMVEETSAVEESSEEETEETSTESSAETVVAAVSTVKKEAPKWVQTPKKVKVTSKPKISEVNMAISVPLDENAVYYPMAFQCYALAGDHREKIKINCFWDTGSDHNWCRLHQYQELKYRGIPEVWHIRGFTGEIALENSNTSKFHLETIEGDFVTITVSTKKRTMNRVNRLSLNMSDLSNHQLKPILAESAGNCEVDLILGQEVFGQMLLSFERVGRHTLWHTRLGKCLSGPTVLSHAKKTQSARADIMMITNGDRGPVAP